MQRQRGAWGILAVTMLAVAMVFAFAASAFAAERSPECLTCHSTMGQDWSVGDVNRDTACAKCHTPGLAGTHPYHNGGGNCGAVCHTGWGESLLSAVPSVVTTGGSFSSAASLNTSSSALHIIHATPRWAKGVVTADSKCAACHNAAACDSCHEDVVDPPSGNHTLHSSTGNAFLAAVPSSYNPQSSWTGTVTYGVVGEDQTIDSSVSRTNYCSTAGCHNVAGMKSSNPITKEDFSHAAYPAQGYPEANVVVTTGSWTPKYGSSYTGGRATWSNQIGATLQVTFTGSYFELLSEVDPYRGQAEVYIDNVLAGTFDTYGTLTKQQQVVYRSPALTSGTHTAKVRILGTKQVASRGTWVFVDAFKVYASAEGYAAPKCTQCHSDKNVSHGYTYAHVASATAGTYGGYTCDQCHQLALIDEHKRPSAKTSQSGSVCSKCHTTYAPYTMPGGYNYTCYGTGATIDGASTGCHVANETRHNGFDTTHTPTADASEAKCRSCHAGNLDLIHNNSIVSNDPDVVTDCLSCHGPNKAPTTKSCVDGCHLATNVNSMEQHPYPIASHIASPTDSVVPTATTNNLACSTCHNLQLNPEHIKTSSTAGGTSAINCSTCHDLAYLPATWDDKCTYCHTTGKAPVAHGSFAVRHDFSVSAANVTDCGGADCHDVTNVATIHNNDATDGSAGTCTSCHDAVGSPTKKLCADCHLGHNLATPHQSGAFPASTECLRCHDGFNDINTAHPSCSTCHKRAGLKHYLQFNYTAACTDCHSTGANKLGTVYTPDDPNHYTGTESTHSANAAQAADTFDYDGVGTAYAPRRCDACHNMEMKPEHITKSYTYFAGVPATYADKCIACHEQRVDALTGVPKTASWNKTCTACHATKHAATTTAHNATNVSISATQTAGQACGTAGCHDVVNIQAIHNNSVTSNDASGAAYVTNCNNTCHSAAPVQATKNCMAVGCHAGMPEHNADHAPAANNTCALCHESPDDKVVHGGASQCVKCHSNPSYPGLTTTNTTVCIDCHNAAEVFAKDYTVPDAHYVGEETSHTSSGNGTYNSYQCSQCHLLEMKPEHAKTSASFTGTTTPLGKCVSCHETKVDNFTLAWDKKCASCHPSTHTERPTKHNASAVGVGAGCGGTGCHAVNDVAVIHNNSITTNAMVPSCVTCHSTNASVPVTITCETAGCHLGMQHGHALDLTNSNYNNTNVTGCTNSGIGCHGSMATSPTPDYAVAQYHPSNGCQSGLCHKLADGTTPNPSQAATTFNNPQTCQNCHGGRTVAPLNYTNAPDRIPLTSLTASSAGGHYSETSHTIVALNATMSVGGASSATCITCHQHVNPTGIDGEWYQHQVLQGYGNTTCVDCHSFVTPGDVAGTSRVGNFIRSAVASNTDVECVSCHNALVMGVGYEIHETTSSPPATATVMSTPTFQCGDPECHGDSALNGGNPLEIHFLHKGDGKIIPYQRWDGSQYTTYTATRCDLVCHNYVAPYTMSNLTTTTECERRPEPQCVDCHDPLLQGWKPSAKTCGVNGACHITSPHSQMGPAHSVTALSQACIDCHETTDLRSNHGYTSDDTCGAVGSNNVCHNLEGTVYTYNSVQYTFTLQGKKECADCHSLGKMPSAIRNHAPHDPNHYVDTETTHTASAQTGGFGKIYSVVATEGFNSVSIPTSWSVSNTNRVVMSTSSPFEGTRSVAIGATGTVTVTDYIQRTFDTAAVSSPTVGFYFKTLNFSAPGSATVSYSTEAVPTNFTSIWTTTTTQSAWTTVGPLAVPRTTTLTIRFSATTNAANEDFMVDMFNIKPGDGPDVACSSCHYMELKPEHWKTTAEATRVPSIYPDKCVDCHENKTDVFDVTRKSVDWNRTCNAGGVCHVSTHLGQTAKHDASSVAAACGGSGCHYIQDVAVIHNNSATGNATVTDCANTCHTSQATIPATLNCGDANCHPGMTAHAHTLDRDGSLFNPATVTGCVDSGAGCHGNDATTNYATGYHAAVGCLNGDCHNANAWNHNDTQFNDPNTCMNCHGGGAAIYGTATDRIPVAGATPNGHYPETTHTAAAAARTASMTAGGTISARCNQCHNEVSATEVDGLYAQHQGLGGGLGNTTCVDCHNYNVGVIAEITGNWTTDVCSDCHNVTDMPTMAQHSSTAPSVNATEAQGVGTCQSVGCHTTLDLHALHKGNAVSTPATRAALGCAFTGCHDYTKQGAKPTKKTCGTGGDCHTTDSHNPLAHAVKDTGTVDNCYQRCHEGVGGAAVTDIRDVYLSTGYGNVKAHDGCSSCHNGGANLGASSTAECVSCHDGTKLGTHPYTPYSSVSTAPAAGHYYNASHDSSLSSSGSWGTGTYGSTLSDYHGATINYERGCTTCHTIDLLTEHQKSSVSTATMASYADVCVGCHELKADNLTARWAGGCGGESNNCHNMAALHSNWSTKHDASNQTMATPGTRPYDIALGAGWFDGFESGSFASWTSADTAAPGAATAIWNATMSGTTNWTSTIAPTTPALGRAFATNTNTTAGALRTAQTNGQTGTDTIYVRYRGTSGIATTGLMTSAVMNLSTYSQGRLSWWDTITGAAAGNNMTVQWSSNNGTSWQDVEVQTANEGTLAQGGWVQHSVSGLPVGTQCLVRWSYTQAAGAGQFTYTLDNILVEGLATATNPGWDVQTTSKQTGTYAARGRGGDATTRYITKTGADTAGAGSVELKYAISYSGLNTGDALAVEYYDGAWNVAKTYTLTGASVAWTSEPTMTLPAATSGVRFKILGNASTDLVYVDDVRLVPIAAAAGNNSLAWRSCQNNPDGAQCHDVTDVADIHSRIPGRTDNGCPICHTSTTVTATKLNCQDAACHSATGVGLQNVNTHDTGWHESAIGNTTLFGTGFAATWCNGCHDDSLDNEHFVLTAYKSTPCSICHKKATDSASPISVTSANTSSTIHADSTSGNALCTQCHTTVTKAAPHIQRKGVTGVAGTNQFLDNYSGHKVYATMPGAMTSGNLAGYTITSWTLPANNLWLKSVAVGGAAAAQLTPTTQIWCSDCHGTVTGATGPHGAAMTVNYATGYDNSFTTGVLYNNAGTMSNTTNLCAKCHVATVGTYGTTDIHNRGDHQGNSATGGKCTACHIKVPHAWKRPRLIGYTTDPAPYSTTGFNGIAQRATETYNGWVGTECGGCGEHTVSGTVWP